MGVEGFLIHPTHGCWPFNKISERLEDTHKENTQINSIDHTDINKEKKKTERRIWSNFQHL